MEERPDNRIPDDEDPEIQHEDVGLKTAMRFFADELLPYFGIEGKVVAIGPTELVHLDVKKLFQDFNLIMADGKWKHFEFQSKNEGVEGLKRFRAYEAVTSYQYKVEVSTYVLYSGNIKNPMTELKQGGSTYRIIPIIMKDRDADKLIAALQEKIRRGEEITRQDLIPLSLCLLMGGETPLKNRVRSAYEITRKAENVNPEEVEKVEAVLYVMAEKFLESMDMDEILEEISMTRMGQKLVDKGREEGRIAGREEGRIAGKEEGRTESKLIIARNMLGLLDEHVIAEKVGLSLEKVMELKGAK